jgi:hypothetical protein
MSPVIRVSDGFIIRQNGPSNQPQRETFRKNANIGRNRRASGPFALRDEAAAKTDSEHREQVIQFDLDVGRRFDGLGDLGPDGFAKPLTEPMDRHLDGSVRNAQHPGGGRL